MIQPLIALLLGVRDGKRDARIGAVPFLWNVAFERGDRSTALLSALNSVWKLLLVATLLDAVLQLLILRNIHVGYAVLTGCLLVALPYAVARALANRVVTHHPPRRHERIEIVPGARPSM